MSPTSPLAYLPFAGLVGGFLLSGSGIFVCASPDIASSKLSGYRDTGTPSLPAGLRFALTLRGLPTFAMRAVYTRLSARS